MLITKDMLLLLKKAGPLKSPGKFRAAEVVRTAEQSPPSGGGCWSFIPV